MNIIHRLQKEELLSVIPEPLAEAIIRAREGKLKVEIGGGGLYGKVMN